jgi:TonB family protein
VLQKASPLLRRCVRLVSIVTDPIGVELGQYKILSLLGRGGMGAVYLAENAKLGRKAAVKVLLPQYAAQKDIVDRFFNEARAANVASHQGIVDIYDYGEDPRVGAYLVMEYLEGESLEERLKAGAMPLDGTLRVIEHAAIALTAAHERSIVHRDLKPANIFLVPDPYDPGQVRVKLLDFGIAKLADSNSTKSGVLMGTPAYMSPEQCDGAKYVDHRSDIYSLAVIAYEMLCGRPPFVAQGTGRLLMMHQVEPPPSPREFRGDLPEPFEAVLLQALAKKPEDRFQQALGFASALKHAAAGQAASAGAIPNTRVSRTPSAATHPATHPASIAVAETIRSQPMQPENSGSQPVQGENSGSQPEAPLSTPPASVVRPSEPVAKPKGLLIAGGVALMALLATGAFLLMRNPTPSAGTTETTKEARTNTERAGAMSASQQPGTTKDQRSATRTAPAKTPTQKTPAAKTQTSSTPKKTIAAKEPEEPTRKTTTKKVASKRTKGTLSRTVIRSVIARHIGEVKYCYLKGLRNHPKLAGRVVVGFTIAPSGQVRSARVKRSTLRNREVERCIERAVQRWRFPEPKGGGIVIVSYPFVLRAEGTRTAKAPPTFKAPPTVSKKAAAKACRGSKYAYLRNHWKLSLQYGKVCLRVYPKKQDVLAIVGAAACNLKRPAVAKRSFRRLTPARRNMLRSVCRRRGIDL